MIEFKRQLGRWSLCVRDGHREESPSIKRTRCQLTAGGGDSTDSATEIDFHILNMVKVER